MAEAAIAELQSERQIQRNRLEALETERDLAASPFKRQTLGCKIRTQTQHLFDIETVLDSLRASRYNERDLA